jgi:F420H(2)-dependent quinone reductase
VADASPAFREPSPLARVFNRAFGLLVGLGLGPRDYYLLQVKGRKSGRVYGTPVSLVSLHGVRFLIAPRGRTQWVRNVEASNEVVLKRGASRPRFQLRALSDADKPPVLLAYLERYGSVVQRYFPVPAGSSARAFAEIAARYPVFELLPTGDTATDPGTEERP